MHSLTNSRRIATPVSGFLPGKRHAAPIMHCVIGETLLMTSNTSYHKCLCGLHRFTYHILALFAACKRLAVLAHDLGHEGSILLYFI
jgi:hypothetical protein